MFRESLFKDSLKKVIVCICLCIRICAYTGMYADILLHSKTGVVNV